MKGVSLDYQVVTVNTFGFLFKNERYCVCPIEHHFTPRRLYSRKPASSDPSGSAQVNFSQTSNQIGRVFSSAPPDMLIQGQARSNNEKMDRTPGEVVGS